MMIEKKIRLHKKDTAFVYAILESLEGMTIYSTMPDEPGSIHRDLKLWIPEGFVTDIEKILDGMRKKFPILDLSGATGENKAC